MLRDCFSVIPFCLVFSACTTPQMRVDSGLEAAGTVYEVHGRQGWLVDQQLRFGEFLAGPVSRGWTKGYDYPFIVRFSGAREKLRFAVRADGGGESMSHCIGKLREQDLRAFRGYFDVNLDTTDTFACSTVVEGGAFYDFYAANLNVQQNPGYKVVEGTVRGGAAPVELRSIWHLASGQRSLGTEPLGYEFHVISGGFLLAFA